MPVQNSKYPAKVGNLILIINMNLTQNESQFDFYRDFFELRPSLIIMATTSALITPPCVGMFYFTIWFEINGPDAWRSLMNRLVSPISWICIIYMVLPQTIELVRYFYGPLHYIVCVSKIYLKNVLLLAGQLF